MPRNKEFYLINAVTAMLLCPYNNAGKTEGRALNKLHILKEENLRCSPASGTSELLQAPGSQTELNFRAVLILTISQIRTQDLN